MNLCFLLERIFQGLRNSRARRRLACGGHRAGAGLVVRKGAGLHLEPGAQVSLGAHFTLAEGAQVYVGPRGSLEVGDHVFVGRYTMVICNEAVKIGAGTQIAHFCTIIDSDHDFSRRELPVRSQPALTRAVRIGAECWIAAHAIVLKGCAIGDRAVVGAGAVVTKDVAAQAVVVGNPARALPARGNPDKPK